LALFGGACGEDKTSGKAPDRVPELIPVPHPVLDSVEPAVRQQIEELRKQLEDPGQDGTSEAAALAEAYGNLGLAYQAYDLLDPAEACYENARRLEPTAFLWSYAAGRLARDHRGDLGAAVSAFEIAAKGARSTMRVASLIHLGHSYLEQGNLEEARAAFHRALAETQDKDKASAAVQDGLGRVAVAAKDLSKAAEHFRRALELQPEASRVAYRLGQALRRLGHLEEAKAVLEGQGAQEVFFPDPVEKLIASAGTGTAALLRQGGQAQLAGRFDVAEKLYRQAVDASPEDPAARLSLGAALTHLDDVAGAVEQYQIAARLQPGNPVPTYNLGHLMIRRGDLDQATNQFEAALALEPGHLEARLGLASVAERRRDFEDALARYEALLRDHPGNVQARNRRAVVLASSDRQQEALEELQDLVATAPEAAEPWLNLGTLLAQLGRLDEARTTLETALEKDLPPEAQARAQGFLERLQPGGQQPRPRQPGAQEPTESPSSPYATATALLREDKSLEARKILEEALPKNPGNPRLALTLARVLAAAPDPQARNGRRAVELAQAIHRVLSSPESSEALAMALAEAGRLEEAVELQERLVAETQQASDEAMVKRFRENLARYREGQSALNPWGG